jgi:hypothetical protein
MIMAGADELTKTGPLLGPVFKIGKKRGFSISGNSPIFSRSPGINTSERNFSQPGKNFLKLGPLSVIVSKESFPLNSKIR